MKRSRVFATLPGCRQIRQHGHPDSSTASRLSKQFAKFKRQGLNVFLQGLDRVPTLSTVDEYHFVHRRRRAARQFEDALKNAHRASRRRQLLPAGCVSRECVQKNADTAESRFTKVRAWERPNLRFAPRQLQ